jgi:hypothetical protein
MRPDAGSGALARTRARLGWWVALWDEREPPTTLALIRISLGLVVVVDLVTLAGHGTVTWLWAPVDAGGVPSWSATDAPLFYRIFSASAGSAALLWAGLLASAICIAVGCFTRAATVTHVWLSVQAALINTEADRAIDRLIRIVLMILVLSPAGKTWSIDAKWKTGTFRGDPTPAPAWARYLIFSQLIITYFGAGLAKGGTHWYPWGGYDALYFTLADPILSSVDPRWLDSSLTHFATQLATAVTHLWELAAPLLLVAAFYRRTADRPGRVRHFFNRARVRDLYVAIGVVFHLTLALTLRLGIFPFAMLSCFPAFFRPVELGRFGRWWGTKSRRAA